MRARRTLAYVGLALVFLLPQGLSSQTISPAEFLHEGPALSLFRPAKREAEPSVEPQAILTIPLLASPASQLEIPSLQLSFMDDGSLRIAGNVVASAEGDREILFLVDLSKSTYTATLIPQDPSAEPMYVRFGSTPPPGFKSGGPEKGEPGDPQPLVPIEPPDPCCPDVCSGQHYAYLETRDPVNFILTRTEQNSYWEVTESIDGRCRWSSVGSGFCSTPPQGASTWYVTGCRGSYPSGTYPSMNVFHETIGDYINWDFGDDSQSTAAHHDLYIYRSGRGGQTGISFSFSHSGEYSYLLYITVGDSGRNDC